MRLNIAGRKNVGRRWPMRLPSRRGTIGACRYLVILGFGGITFDALGDTRRTIGFYEQALQIARETGDRRNEGAVLWNMALALDKVGDRPRTTICAEATLVIFEEIESPYTEMVRNRLAEWKASEV